jgi:hypothetical protein
VYGDVESGDFGASGEIPEFGGVEVGGGVRIANFATGLAVEMDVLVKISAVAGLSTLKLNLLNEASRGEVLQAVVNRG